MCKVYYIAYGGTGGCVERGVWILSRPALSSYTPPCSPAAQIYSVCIDRTLIGHYPHISTVIEAQLFTSTVWVRRPPHLGFSEKNRNLSPPSGPCPRGGWEPPNQKNVEMFIYCWRIGEGEEHLWCGKWIVAWVVAFWPMCASLFKCYEQYFYCSLVTRHQWL